MRDIRRRLSDYRRGIMALGLVLMLVLGLPAAASATSAPQFPSPTGYANDYAGILTAADLQTLNDMATELERKTGAEMAVAVVPTTSPLTIEEYAVQLFQKWGVGKKGQDNGFLILLAVQDRHVRVEVGYGLEPVLTDGFVGRVLDENMLPAFREGKYGAGLVQGARVLVDRVEQGVAAGELGGGPAPASPEPAMWLFLVPVAVVIMMALVVIAALRRSLMAVIRPRCPNCGTGLVMMEKVLEKPTLTAPGLVERTWQCPHCGYHTTQRYRPSRSVLAPGWDVRQGPMGPTFWGPFGGFGGRGSGGGFGGFGGGASGGGGASRGF